MDVFVQKAHFTFISLFIYKLVYKINHILIKKRTLTFFIMQI